MTDTMLTSTDGDSRPLPEWLTNFHLASVVLDPYTNESAWILDTARRILTSFVEADVRVAWVVTATAEEAHQFLGPLADELLVFVDPDRTIVKALDLEHLPAFVFVLMDGSVRAKAEGWDPAAWRAVADAIAETTAWTRTVIPAPGDPAPYRGSPATG